MPPRAAGGLFKCLLGFIARIVRMRGRPVCDYTSADGERACEEGDVVGPADGRWGAREHPHPADRRGRMAAHVRRGAPGVNDESGAPREEGERQQGIAAAIAEVSERASVLIREEIELAKTEITEKTTRLA